MTADKLFHKFDVFFWNYNVQTDRGRPSAFQTLCCAMELIFSAAGPHLS